MELIKEIRKKKWIFYVSRKFNWFVESTQILTNYPKTLKKYLDFDCSLKNYLILNGDEYCEKQESKRFNDIFKTQFSASPDFFDDLFKKILQMVNNILNYQKNLKNIEFDKLSNKELIKRLQEFQDIYIKSFVPAWSRPDDYLEFETKSSLKKYLNFPEEKMEALFKKIATYRLSQNLSYNNEPLELLKIAKEIKGKNLTLKNLPPRIKTMIDNHIKSYSWMKGPTLAENVQFSKNEYEERLATMLDSGIDKDIKSIEGTRAQNEIDYQKVIEKYKINGKLLKLLEAVRNFIFLRTYTTEVSDNLFFTARQTILEECARRLKLKNKEVVMLTTKEITSLLNGKNYNGKKKISERNKGFAIVWIKGELKCVFGTTATELQKSTYEYIIESNNNNLKEIKGNPASQGKVRGIVKILTSYKEVNKVNKGDILVTSMTTPDYIFAMEKAAAFITDEGGITCHAAIVAREFGVPCIVGTQNATKILKDGQLVEVDAFSGTVKILNT